MHDALRQVAVQGRDFRVAFAQTAQWRRLNQRGGIAMQYLIDWTKYCDTEIDCIAVFDGFEEVVDYRGMAPHYWAVFLTLKPTRWAGGRECYGDYATFDRARNAARHCGTEIEKANGRPIDGFH